jgi:anti-sigma factor RsiW
MPLIIHPHDYAQCLDPANQDADGLKALLTPYPADEIDAVAASTKVNNPEYGGPECMTPAQVAPLGRALQVRCGYNGGWGAGAAGSGAVRDVLVSSMAYRRKRLRTAWVAAACGPVPVTLWASDPRTSGWPVDVLAAALLVVAAVQATYYYRKWRAGDRYGTER